MEAQVQQQQGLPPAGWYPDSDSPGATRRWWDGHAWTEHRQAESAAAVVAAVSDSKLPRKVWTAMAGVALMIIGGFGPWATAFGVVDVSGTKGDGWIVIGAAAFAGFVVFNYLHRNP